MRESHVCQSAFLLLVALILALSVPFAAETAERWPSRPITIVVPFGAGGGADTSARVLAKHWEKELGTKLLVVNRPGAGAQVGTSYFLRQPVDGYHVLLGAQIFFSSNIILQDAPYSIDDISVLSILEFDNDCLSVPAGSPYRVFEELNAAILNNPGKMRIARTHASPSAIMVDALTEKFKWNIKGVNYENAAERQAALLGGHLDIGVGGVTSALKNDERILAVWAKKRLPSIPNVPTFEEILGDELPVMGTPRFVAVHSALEEEYPDRYNFLFETLKKTFDNPEYREDIKKLGWEDISFWYGPEESDRINRQIHETINRFKDSLGGR